VGSAWPTGLTVHLDSDGRPVAHVSLTRDDRPGTSATSWRLDDGTPVLGADSPSPDTIGIFPVDDQIIEVIASAPGTVTIRPRPPQHTSRHA
jgi:hypothetical protein